VGTVAPELDDEGSSVPALGSLMLLGRERAPRHQACAKDGDQMFCSHGKGDSQLGSAPV
jgi:hypothetical protein